MHPLIFSFRQPDVYEINSTKPDLFVQHDVTSCINDRVMAVPAETSAMHPILFKAQTDTALCKNNVRHFLTISVLVMLTSKPFLQIHVTAGLSKTVLSKLTKY